MKGRFEKTSRSRMIGKAKEELRLGRLNRRKKLVIIFRPFAKRRNMISARFMPYIMPWEKHRIEYKKWEPRKTFEELSPESSFNVQRSYSKIFSIKKDGSRHQLKPRKPRSEVDHNAFFCYQRFVSVSSRSYTYDFVIDLPGNKTEWPVDQLLKLRKRLAVAVGRFNKKVSEKKQRNLVAHFIDLYLCRFLTKNLYERFQQIYCDYSCSEPENTSRISPKWLKKAINCAGFRLRCAESAFFMRE